MNTEVKMDTLQFFLMSHARVHSTEVARAEGGSLADLALSRLGDDQIRLRPRDDLNSVAWLLWHLARAEDVAVNVLVAGRPQVFDGGDWPERLNVPRRDIGTGMTSEEVSELSAKVDVAALRAYRDAVGRRTREGAGALRAAEWQDGVDPALVERAIAEGAFGPNAMWVAELWRARTKAGVLGASVIHAAQHLGEAIVVRSQAGLGLGR